MDWLLDHMIFERCQKGWSYHYYPGWLQKSYWVRVLDRRGRGNIVVWITNLVLNILLISLHFLLYLLLFLQPCPIYLFQSLFRVYIGFWRGSKKLNILFCIHFLSFYTISCRTLFSCKISLVQIFPKMSDK